jgi:hypothetical protein
MKYLKFFIKGLIVIMLIVILLNILNFTIIPVDLLRIKLGLPISCN